MREEGRLRSLQALCAVQLQGTLRVILEPLLVDKPFVGAVTMFFLQKPVSPRTRWACRSLWAGARPLGPDTGFEPKNRRCRSPPGPLMSCAP